jgi:hypothetical protein
VNFEAVEPCDEKGFGRFRCLECGEDLGRGHRNKATRHAKAVHSGVGRAHLVVPLSEAEREAEIAGRLQKKQANIQRWTAKRRQQVSRKVRQA